MGVRKWMGVLVLCALGAACGSPAADPEPRPAQSSEAPRIDDAALAGLRRMSDTLSASKALRFAATAEWNDGSDAAPRGSHTTELRYTLRRPDGLRVEFKGQGDSRLLVYDGAMATLYDRETKYYAITSAPDTLEAALDMLADRSDVIVPLADLLFRNPAFALLEKVTHGQRVGVEEVGGVEAERFAFRQAGLEWEIWIATGDRAVPLRMEFTYLRGDRRAQFSAVMSDWDTHASTRIADFKVRIPGEAEQIEFAIDAEGA